MVCVIMYTTRITQEIRPWPSLAYVQIDASVARWYHCVSRCVRRAFLLEEGATDRKAWIENRIEELAQIFAVAVGGFAVMTNHLHLLLRLDPEVAICWSDEEVVRRSGVALSGSRQIPTAAADFR